MVATAETLRIGARIHRYSMYVCGYVCPSSMMLYKKNPGFDELLGAEEVAVGAIGRKLNVRKKKTTELWFQHDVGLQRLVPCWTWERYLGIGGNVG